MRHAIHAKYMGSILVVLWAAQSPYFERVLLESSTPVPSPAGSSLCITLGNTCMRALMDGWEKGDNF